MKTKKASLVTLASFLLTTLLFAQSSYERELTALEEQHDKDIATPISRYQSSLEQLMRRATQNGDIDTALRVSEKLASLRTPDKPAKPVSDSADPLIGKWIHKSSSGFVGEDEFLPDGKFRSGGRYGTWKRVGSHIETTVGDYLDYYRLPFRDGKIYGVNKNGAFSIILIKISQ